MGVLCEYMCMHCVCAWDLSGTGEEVKSFETGITISCEPLCACWELNPCPLDKKPKLFNH